MSKDIEKDQIIFKKYKIESNLGKGSFGFVYSGENIKDKTKVAIKFESKNAKVHMLEKESYFLSLLKGVGIPEIKSYGYNKKYYILVQELLGENLMQLLRELNSVKLNLKDISMIAIQIIDRLEFVHSKNIVHRDIKPENFLLGYENKKLLYLIDFGISRKYRSSRTGKHIKYTLTGKLFGTLRFLSYNATRGLEQSRRDDLESVGYMLVFLSGKGLPWQGYSIHGPKAKTNYQKILELKKKTEPENICRSLPKEFSEYINYCRRLYFEQTPDYEYLRNLFKKVLKKFDTINDLNFSWLNRCKKIDLLEKNKNKKYDDTHSLSKEKYINYLRRKESPQVRLYHTIKKSLLSDSSPDKINLKEKENVEDKNKSYDKHKRLVSYDSINKCNSFSTNLSKEGGSYDSGKVQYNVNIAEIGEEIKKDEKNDKELNQNYKNNEYNILKNNFIRKNNNYINSSNNIFNYGKNYFSKKYKNKKNYSFRLSLDLDKKFVSNNNNEFKNYSDKKINPQTFHNKTESKYFEDKIREERRRKCCANIYNNVINKYNNYITKLGKKLINKKLIIPRVHHKYNTHINSNNFSVSNINNNKNYTSNTSQNYKKIPKKVNSINLALNNIIYNKNNTINNPDFIPKIKTKVLKTKTFNLNGRITNTNANIGMRSPNIPEKKIIIINNNINCITPHRYITIKERKNLKNNIQINKGFSLKSINNNIYNYNPLISNHKRMLGSDNYTVKSINNNMNRVLEMNIGINNIKCDTNKYQDIKTFNDRINRNRNYIQKQNRIVLNNKSNDDINKRIPHRNIKVFNYKSIISRSPIQLSKYNNIIERKKTELNRIYLAPNLKPLTKNKIKLGKLNNQIPKSNNNINNNNYYLLNRINNNFKKPNINSYNLYFPTENNCFDASTCTNVSKNTKRNNQNIYNKLDENKNNILSSKSNVNFFENYLNKKNKKKLNYKSSNSIDSRIYRYIPTYKYNLNWSTNNYIGKQDSNMY